MQNSEEINIEGLVPSRLFHDEVGGLGKKRWRFKRGLSLNPRNKNLIMKDRKIVVKYHSYGVSCEPEASMLSTFFEVLACTSMPIT